MRGSAGTDTGETGAAKLTNHMAAEPAARMTTPLAHEGPTDDDAAGVQTGIFLHIYFGFFWPSAVLFYGSRTCCFLKKVMIREIIELASLESSQMYHS